MLRRRLRSAATPVSPAAVAIAGDDLGGETEGVIERVQRIGAEVDVVMLLSDGGSAVARLCVEDWDWLELRVGDIIAVRLLSG